MAAVISPPSDSTKLAEAIFTLRRHIKKDMRRAEKHYRAGRLKRVKCLAEEIQIREVCCFIAISKAAYNGIMQHFGYHKLVEGRWIELLTCGRYTLYRPCPRPKAGTRRVSYDFDIDAIPKNLPAMRKKAATAIVLGHCSNRTARIKTYFWRDKYAGREWMRDLCGEHEDEYEYEYED